MRLRMLLPVIGLYLSSCESSADRVAHQKESAVACTDVPKRFPSSATNAISAGNDTGSTENMVFIEGGTFSMGGDNKQASEDEYPKHSVKVNGFWIDKSEVTNAQFAAFVAATGYITTAERAPDWEEIKKTLPAGTPKPADSLLVPASLVFHQTSGPVDLHNYSSWWTWEKGADWKHPEGPRSSLKGRENYPVVQVSWELYDYFLVYEKYKMDFGLVPSGQLVSPNGNLSSKGLGVFGGSARRERIYYFDRF